MPAFVLALVLVFVLILVVVLVLILILILILVILLILIHVRFLHSFVLRTSRYPSIPWISCFILRFKD